MIGISDGMQPIKVSSPELYLILDFPWIEFFLMVTNVWKAWPLPIFLICVNTAAVPSRSGLRSAVRGDLVVPRHRTEWGSRSFAVADSKCCNKLPVGLRDLSVGPETFVWHLSHIWTHLNRAACSVQVCSNQKSLLSQKSLLWAGFSDSTHTFEFVLHFSRVRHKMFKNHEEYLNKQIQQYPTF